MWNGWYYICGGFFVYMSVSYLCLKKPLLLRKKKTYKAKIINDALQRNGTMNIAHRGGSMERVENTLVAFKNGVQQGAIYLEMDIQITKDEQVVVCHDGNLKRLCGVDKQVSDFNYDELPKFQKQIPMHFSPHESYDTTREKPEDLYIVKLEEVFQALPNTMMNIDLKLPSDKLIVKASELILKYDRQHLTVWGASRKRDGARLRKVNPNISQFFSAERLLLTYIWFFTGLLPFFDIFEDSMQMIFLTKEVKAKRDEASRGVKILFSLLELFSWATGPVFDHLSKRGVICILWVLNNEEDFQSCLEKKPHGIMTDAPQLLTSFMKKKGIYLQSNPQESYEAVSLAHMKHQKPEEYIRFD